GSLLDWRKLTRSTRAVVLLTLVIGLLLLLARAILWIALREGGFADISLLPAAPLTRFANFAFASPFDFLLNTLLVAGLVTLAVSSFDMWRAAHRPGVGAVVVDRLSRSV